jgi:Na+/H+-dicarboxylate symporter
MQLVFGHPFMIKAGAGDPLYGSMLMTKLLFVSLLRALVGPVVFFSLAAGLVGIARAAGLSRLAGATLLYYFTTTAIAIAIGLFAVKVIHPWTSEPPGAALGDGTRSWQMVDLSGKTFLDQDAAAGASVVKKLGRSMFSPPWKAFDPRQPAILPIVGYGLLAGLCLMFLTNPGSRPRSWVLKANMFVNRILALALWTAPLGVMAIVFDFSLRTDGRMFSGLLQFALLVFAATMVHGALVLPGLAAFFGKCSPRRFFTGSMQPLLLALSTASSSATLPSTMRACEQEHGVSPEVSGFVCPMGATMNMDGTALFEGIAAVFLAWLYHVDLGSGGVVAIFLMAMISSIGAPGMPSASMSGMQMVLLAAGIPLEAIGILLIIERPLDTFRTAVNVEGDIAGAIIVNRYYQKHRGEGSSPSSTSTHEINPA